MDQKDIPGYYRQQIEKFATELKALNQKKATFAWLRLLPVGAIIISFYLLVPFGISYVAVATVVLLIAFIRLVYADLNTQEKIRYTRKLIDLYTMEMAALDAKPGFENGNRYADKEHPYTADLDIFGDSSLFQHLNRTTSEPGSDRLAGYLSAAAPLDTINKRQQAVRELAKEPEWLKRMQAFGTLHPLTNSTAEKLLRWVNEPNKFLQFRAWGWIRFILPAFSISSFLLYLNGTIDLGLFLVVLLIMGLTSWRVDRGVNPIHKQLDEIARQLGSLSSAILLIEKRAFDTELLANQRARILDEETKASEEIKQIKTLLERLDLRYNMAVSIFLNLFLLWNLHQILGLEHWKVRNRQKINGWLETLAEFEALSSLAHFSFNHPSFTFPTVTDDYFFMEGSELGHPLIPKSRRVDNPAHLPAAGKIMLVTGSNMAGKSTYLRSVGINCVLAFCGSAVCASSFKVSLVSVVSSMRVADNLQESTSTFYAELKKLKVIIDKVNAGEKVLILLDEILRGTNSHDRHTGSKALIKQLIHKGAAGIIATHDLELAEMQESYSSEVINYHFDVQVSNEELYFDYRLKPGICRSMNASILMKKIGIEI